MGWCCSIATSPRTTSTRRSTGSSFERLEAQAVELEEQAQGLELQMTEERELAERLALLGAAVHASTESVLITTAEVDPPGPRIVFVNPAACRMTGYAEREMLGRTPRMLQGPQTDRAVLVRLRGALVAGEPFSGRTVNYRKDGTPYTVEWDIAPVRDARGQLTHFVAVQRDVSARERLEAQVRQAQKMEAVGQLAGGVAHDFNNLLTVIVNHVDFLRAARGAHDPRHDELDGIRYAADAAMRLTRQLLTFSRHQRVARRTLDVNAAVRAADGLLRRVVGEHIVIDTALGDGVPPVLADPGELEQVILNLAVNARDAMPGGGRLRIVTIAADDGARLEVRDTGRGMDAATRARIFEPFFTTKGVGEGTGLGLATVFGIVERLRGTIAVASEPGQGTSFSIWLPRAPDGAGDARGARAARSARPLAPGAGEVILIVEDEPALRRVARRVLVSAGYVVHEASGGEEALAVAGRLDRLDLLLTDVVMPGLRGSTLAERLRQARAGLRVLYVSGYTDDVAVERERTERGTTFLQKPFDAATLAGAVRAVLDAPAGDRSPPPSGALPDPGPARS
jgi:PAS domain S-box-containing protein